MPRILLIDDDEQVRTVICRMLEREGYEVIEAADGEEGLERFADSAPDLILTDIIMPNKEGIETISMIKKKKPDTKIIAMSGGGQYITVETCLETARLTEIEHVLQKPFERNELLKVVADALAA
jgi:CheY-like chemotaxis protein